MNLFYRALLIVFFLNTNFSEEVMISRDYLINKNLFNDKTINDSIFLDGTLSFQVCDTSMCIPVNQDLTHTVTHVLNENNNNLFSISDSHSDIFWDP